MSKSNPVHLWKFGCTRALIFTQTWLDRPGWHLQKKNNGQKSFFFYFIIKNKSVSGENNVQCVIASFFVHFQKLIRPHPGPLWGGGHPCFLRSCLTFTFGISLSLSSSSKWGNLFCVPAQLRGGILSGHRSPILASATYLHKIERFDNFTQQIQISYYRYWRY